jgi:hypothetical protein
MGQAPEPLAQDPPWKKIMIGSKSDDVVEDPLLAALFPSAVVSFLGDGVYTLRKRQSSEGVPP